MNEYDINMDEDGMARETVYASFEDILHAERAAGALMDFGVRKDDLSLVARESADASAHNGHSDTQNSSATSAGRGITTTTPDDAAMGAITGAEVGLGVGIAAALAAMLVPGVGLVVGGGALAAAMAGAAGATAAGAVAGGVHGYLKDQGVPADALATYTGDYHSGRALLAVTVPSHGVDQVTTEHILTKYHGSHVASFKAARL